MFNYHNRQYVFRQSTGELWDFFCDSRQNLCYNTLTRRGSWSNGSAILKNTYQYFYADMDQDDTFHLLFQDTDGNIHYSRLDGQTIKSVPVLNSKTPAAYNKQLFIAPFKNNVHFFYVLQHDNSFILAYQVLSNNRISNPHVIDYVSGSSLPYSVVYDKAQNIYVFYQSYDGKYLQLGYKKLNTAQKSWSEFTPITKYSGNCEYPHAIIDQNGIIHLCYQRRAPKLFEMVYQQKSPDRNLWSAEEIVHSSIYSFENSSILQENGNVTIYWVREETIYYNSSPQTGNNWGKAARLNFPAGRQLQCLCYKSNSPLRRPGEAGEGREEGDVSALFQLPPAIYPGTLSNGLKLAFSPSDSIGAGIGGAGIGGAGIGDISQLLAGDSSQRTSTSRERSNSSNPFSSTASPGYTGSGNFSSSSSSDIRNLVLDAFKQLQRRFDETKEGSSATRDELARLTNAYDQLNRELGKYSIRLGMLESQLGQAKKLNSRLEEFSSELKELKELRNLKDSKEPKKGKKPDGTVMQNVEIADSSSKKNIEIVDSNSKNVRSERQNQKLEPEQLQQVEQVQQLEQEPFQTDSTPNKTAPSSLDPDKLKEWEEWEEPKEWQ